MFRLGIGDQGFVINCMNGYPAVFLPMFHQSQVISVDQSASPKVRRKGDVLPEILFID